MIFYSIAKFWNSGFRAETAVRINVIASLTLNAVSWALLYYKLHAFSYLSPLGTIMLHYNVYFGIDLIGKWYLSFMMPILGLIVIVVNTLIAYLILPRERVLGLMILYLQTVLSIIILTASIFIVLLNY